jgi:hypothetical protein
VDAIILSTGIWVVLEVPFLRYYTKSHLERGVEGHENVGYFPLLDGTLEM